MNIKFSPRGCEEWELDDDRIVYDNKEIIHFEDIVKVSKFSAPTALSNGVIQLSTKNGEKYFLAVSKSQKDLFQVAFYYISKNYGDEKHRVKREKENAGIVYDLQGVRGKYMRVYENRVVIGVKAGMGSLITGNVSDGEKTMYYKDCIGIQFKESGLQIGYLQLETASGIMNKGQSNFFNENSFTFDTSVQSNDKMNEVADYIRAKVEEAKNGSNQTVVKEVSAADEIKKFKELLDMGIISQEEFDAKKKQLLGL